MAGRSGQIHRLVVAELFGTFCLVLAGAGAITINDVSGGMVSHLGVAVTFGLVVMVVIRAIGRVSGAHINPAVTIGCWAARRLPSRLVLPYVLGQFAGALLASGLLRGLFPAHATLGITVPSGPALQSLVLEMALTGILMFVILSVCSRSRVPGMTAGATIGAVIVLAALFAGPVSGASMNPARSLGPALVAGHLDSLWIYLVAPVLGALAAVPLCRFVHAEDCCSDPCDRPPAARTPPSFPARAHPG